MGWSERASWRRWLVSRGTPWMKGSPRFSCRSSKCKGPEVGTGWELQEEPEAVKTSTEEMMGVGGCEAGELRSGEGAPTVLLRGCHSKHHRLGGLNHSLEARSPRSRRQHSQVLVRAVFLV